MPLTLEKIGKQAGVSRSTVSRVLNNHPHVSPRARARVLAVTEKHNFQPNLAARSLAAGRTGIIGLIIPQGVTALFADPFFPLLIQGVTSACNAHNLSVMLWLAEPEYERRMISQVLHNGLIDGFVVASVLVDDPLLQSLTESKTPFVLVGRHPTQTGITYVDVDNVSSTRDLVAYLIGLGRRRVATITGPQNMIVGVDRLQGYLAALREHGICADPALIASGGFTEVGGYAAMQQIMSSKPDAVFCASDAMAVGALRAIREADLRVPEDIALVGFDDMPFSPHTAPPLTTVRQPILRTAVVAAETLIDMLANPNSEPRRIILPTELVIRSSSGMSINN